MKTKKIILVLIVSVLTLTLNAQKRCKHPRVKVKPVAIIDYKEEQKEPISHQENAPIISIFSNENIEEVKNNIDETAVAGTNSMVVSVNHKNIIPHKNPKKIISKKADSNFFTQKFKEQNKLLRIQDTQKTNMALWVKLLIVCLVVLFVGLTLIILGLMFYGSLGVLFWTIGWILFGLALLAGILILILGLTGVI